MQIRVIDQTTIRRLLPMDGCVDLMADVLSTLARGDAVQPLRSALRLPSGRGLLGVMPAYVGDIDAPGVKVVTVYPGNHGTRYDSHQGVVVLFEGAHGQPVALLDGTEVTAIRTAAVSGVATRQLARERAATLALIGSGVQAREHLRAMLAVRPIATVRVWSRRPDNATRFAAREAKRHGIAIEAATSAREAVEGADIVCTTTAAMEPVVQGSWLQPGTHINAAGACIPAARELDSDAVACATLFVDRRESAFHEAGDFLIPKREGRFADSHIVAELGDVLIDRHRGRTGDAEITLFKSLGLGVEDVATARYVYDRAVAEGAGTEIELGGERDEA